MMKVYLAIVGGAIGVGALEQFPALTDEGEQADARLQVAAPLDRIQTVRTDMHNAVSTAGAGKAGPVVPDVPNKKVGSLADVGQTVRKDGEETTRTKTVDSRECKQRSKDLTKTIFRTYAENQPKYKRNVEEPGGRFKQINECMGRYGGARRRSQQRKCKRLAEQFTASADPTKTAARWRDTQKLGRSNNWARRQRKSIKKCMRPPLSCSESADELQKLRRTRGGNFWRTITKSRIRKIKSCIRRDRSCRYPSSRLGRIRGQGASRYVANNWSRIKSCMKRAARSRRGRSHRRRRRRSRRRPRGWTKKQAARKVKKKAKKLEDFLNKLSTKSRYWKNINRGGGFSLLKAGLSRAKDRAENVIR